MKQLGRTQRRDPSGQHRRDQVSPSGRARSM